MFARVQPLKRSWPSSSSSIFSLRTTSRGFQSRAPLAPRSCSPPTHRNFSVFLSKRAFATDRVQRSGTGLWSAAIVFGIAIGGALLIPLATGSANRGLERRDSGVQFDVADLTDSYLVMAPNTPPGRPGTLTADEEKKLRQLWAMTLKVFGVEAAAEETNGVDAQSTATSTTTTTDTVSDKEGKKDKKKSRLNVFKRNKDDKATESKTEASSGTSTPDISQISISADDDKFGQTADFKAAIANTPPEELRRAFWDMVKHDHPDALLLRFLRARKWDVEKALVMMISTMHWRIDEMHVDDDIMKNGELGALEEVKSSSDAKAKKNSEDFLTQLRMGKSYTHGLDIDGRPMSFVRARLHRAGEQTEQSLERFTVYTIETARMLLRPPIDTATIVFDMTDFSMANMDYTPVKFMIKCFEANYPESLGNVLVYKAPWVFNAIWTIIRGWLDPVVASKVHFAKDIKELEKFVPRSQIPAELGGDEKWTYEYPEPVPGENAKMADTETRAKLEAERSATVEKYERTVKEWVRDPEGKSLEERRKERDAVAEDLRRNYWLLDPYVRARSLYDRMGVISEAGKLEFYPAKKEPAAVAPTAETSADDVD